MSGTSYDSYINYPALSDDQQRLLLAALQSNERRLPMEQLRAQGLKQSGPLSPTGSTIFKTVSNGQTVNPGVSPQSLEKAGAAIKSNFVRQPTFGDSFLPDFSQNADFDIDLPQNVTDTLSSFGNEDHAGKRKSPEEDAEGELEMGSRRNSDEKAAKKPGRRPAENEPTTKRKAQNRAAQRAFRERKEQHLKDLETKIDDLHSASQTANQENSLLRAQVMRLQNELRDYKRRLSNTGVGLRGSSLTQGSFSTSQTSSPQTANPFDFSFGTNASFDTFSSLPTQTNSNGSPGHDSSSYMAMKEEPSSRSNSNGAGRSDRSGHSKDQSTSRPSRQNSSPAGKQADPFSPSLVNFGSTAYGFPQFGSPGPVNLADSPPHRSGSRSASEQAPSLYSNGDSPSMGSVSQHGPGSSCGASPEPHGQSKNTAYGDDVASKDPLGNLSDFQFNPDTMLFGGYRDSQDAIFGGGDFSGGLYDDWLGVPGDDVAFDIANNSMAKTPSRNAGNLMDFVEQQREAGGDDLDPNIHPSADDQNDKREIMTCHKIWQQLQNCPKFEKGEIDIDNLCGELQKKATCTETGASIDKAEWEKALWRIAGAPQHEQRKQA